MDLGASKERKVPNGGCNGGKVVMMPVDKAPESARDSKNRAVKTDALKVYGI
jgi:hypothetical protein